MHKFVTSVLTCRRVCRCSQACRHSKARALAAHRSGEQSSALLTDTDMACSHRGQGCRRNLRHSPRSGAHRCCQHTPVRRPLLTTLNFIIFILPRDGKTTTTTFLEHIQKEFRFRIYIFKIII